MELLFLDGLSFLENVDFVFITYILGFVFCIFWLFVVGWVWFDSSERYSSVWLRIFSVATVLLFNILGFLVYLIVRPRTTRDDNYWMDLERRYLKFEAAGLEDCPKCGWEVLPNYIFCPNCGETLRKKCKSCEVYLEPEWDVCPFCGVRQRKFDIKNKYVKVKDDIVNKKPVNKKMPEKKRKSILKDMKSWFVGSDGLVRLKGSVSPKNTKNTDNNDGHKDNKDQDKANNKKNGGKKKNRKRK